jgi:hypothetical protein
MSVPIVSEFSDLSIEEFVQFSSPRYFRLVFSEYKPQTKNGDLVNAMFELIKANILTTDSTWEKIKLTKKGSNYKKFVKSLMDLGALYRDQSDGLFDYHSEPGRKIIIQLIQFLSSKLNFTQYFKLLSLPLPENEEKNSGSTGTTKALQEIDDDSEDVQKELLELLKVNRINQRRSLSITRTLAHDATPIRMNIGLIKRYFKNWGFSRPEPLLAHFETCKPSIFSVQGSNFYVNFLDLSRIKIILEENLSDFHNENENKWLSDYFEMLKLPTQIFGFQKSDFAFATKELKKEADTFLNLAIEGPKFFATQYSTLDIGELQLILFPINDIESLIIYCTSNDMLYYFTIPSEKFSFNCSLLPNSFPNFPETFRTSRKRFGKLLESSLSPKEVKMMQQLKDTSDREARRGLDEEYKTFQQELNVQLTTFSHLSAAFFSICQSIADKITPYIRLNKTICFFKSGIINHYYIDTDTILTTIQKGTIEFGSDIKGILKKIDASIQEILKED